MSIDPEKSDSAAASWYRWHGIVSQPNYRFIEYFKRYRNPVNPSVLDNCSTKVKEYIYRAFGPITLASAAAFLVNRATLPQLGLIGIGLLAFEIGRTALHLLGFAAQKKNHLYVKGDLQPIHTENPKLMSFNVLGFPAGMNYTCGGARPFRHRFPEIAKTIRDNSPDIVVLQECLMDASVTEAFVNAFKSEYAHFYTHNGPNKLGLESGLLVMTKCHVTGYHFTPFGNNDWYFKRGFATLKIPASDKGRPAFAVIGTHMEAGYSPEDSRKRHEQLNQIKAHANNLSDSAFIIGDLNIDAGQEAERELLNKYLEGVNAPPKLATCTNELNKIVHPNEERPTQEEWVDQIARIKTNKTPELVLSEVTVIPVYTFNRRTDSRRALSDHNPIIATISKSKN